MKGDFASRIKEFIRGLPAWLWEMRFFILSIAVAVVLFYAILLISFWRIKDKITDYISQTMKCEVRVDKVHMSPSLRVDMTGLRIWAPGEKNEDGADPMLTAGEVSLWPDFISLLGGKVMLRRVLLKQPEFDLRRNADGSFNISPWLKHTVDCNLKKVSGAFPRGIKIEGGEIRVWPGPDAVAPLRVTAINGLAGLAPKGQIGVRISGRVFGSDVLLTGGMWPCSFESLGFTLKSDNFYFGEAYNFAVTSASGGEAPPRPVIPLGTGTLAMEVTGNIDSPSVSGSVSLRDFDADFSLSGPMLNLTDVKAGIGLKKVIGMGGVNLAAPGLPYNMEFNLQGMSFGEFFRGAVSAANLPEGEVMGRVRVDGRLTSGKVMSVRGDFTVRNGVFRVPFVPVGPGSAIAAPVLVLPFETLNASVRVDKGSLIVEKISMKGKDYTAQGGARIGALPDPARGFAHGFDYAANISIDADDAASLLAKTPLYRGLLKGRLKGRASLSGDTRVRDSSIATAVFEMNDGTITNPYAVGDRNAVLTADFTRLTANVRYARGAVDTAGTVSGSGVAVTWSGKVLGDGTMSLTGTASVGPDVAGFFPGLYGIMPVDSTGTVIGYRSRFSVSGNMRSPQTSWQGLEVLHGGIAPVPDVQQPEIPELEGVQTTPDEQPPLPGPGGEEQPQDYPLETN